MPTTRFSSMPNISLSRTKMPVSFTHSTTFLHGKLVPLFAAFVQPGDSFHLDLASLIRMSTPKFPIFGNIEVKAYSFFVPMRLVFDRTEEFFGENKTSSGPQTEDIKLPSMEYGKVAASDAQYWSVVGSVSHYLGKPLKGSVPSVSSYYHDGTLLNVLKERCYYLIWNEYFRAQQFQDPYLVYKSSESGIGQTPAGDDLTWASGVLDVNKKFDYFTSATVAPQYSADPVEIPLGDYAPLGVIDVDKRYHPSLALGNGEWSDTDVATVYFGASTESQGEAYGLVNRDRGELAFNNDVPIDNDNVVNISVGQGTDYRFLTNVVANLSEAVAANVNTIRTAFAMQRYLERDLFGTRYPEWIKSHFGVNSSIAILQRPQLLKKASWNINIQQVLTTAETGSGDTERPVGAPGANSVTANRSDIVNNAFDEFGYLFVVIETKHDQLYSQGFDAFDIKLGKYDFYYPEFATIGDQAILNKQIFAQGNQAAIDVNGVFGYQEAWAEYRYFNDRVSGLQDPSAPNNLSFMNLAIAYNGSDVNGINGTWLKEDRSAIARALVTGEDGPDYMADFALTGSMIRTMPLYSIPGLIDHVGGR